MPRHYADKDNHAIFIDQFHIHKLAEAMDKSMVHAEWPYETIPVPEPRYEWAVEFSDKTKDSGLTTEEVLKCQNSRRRQIIALHVAAKASFPTVSLSLDGHPGSAWRMYANGNESLINAVKGEFPDVLAELKPWWSRFSKIDFGLYVLAIFFILVSMRLYYAFVVLGVRLPDDSPDATWSDWVDILRALSPWIIAMAVVSICTDQFRKYFFPEFLVTLGDGKRRADHNKTRRRFLFGLAIPLLLFLWARASDFKPTPDMAPNEQSIIEQPQTSAD
jgi:hypothetical protein